MVKEMRPGALKGRRQAIVIGISEYEDTPTITRLEGARRDAEEIFKRLSDPRMGCFDIPPDHELLGKDATCRRIRRAISDVFYQPNVADLSLFYFSGHGCVDGYGDGYLLPWDAVHDHPFASSINISELRAVLSRSQRKNTSVVMILDCCYSGIGAKGNGKGKEWFEQQVKTLSGSGEGVFVLSSSEADAESREIFYPLDQKETKHGAYTACLLEALDGKVSTDNTGIVNLESLITYTENRIRDLHPKQKPEFYAARARRLYDVRIAVVPRKYYDNIRKSLEKARYGLRSRVPMNLINAAQNVVNLLEFNPDDEDAKKLLEDIKKELDIYKKSSMEYLDRMQLKEEWEPLTARTQKLQILACKLDVEEIISLKDADKLMLSDLCCASLTGNRIPKENHITDDIFISNCKRRFGSVDPASTPTARARYT